MRKSAKMIFFTVFLFLVGFQWTVNAKVICKYSTDGEQDNIILETENDENMLTKASGFANRGTLTKKVTFHDGNGLPLENGNCPTISVYVTRWNADYILYKTKDECEKDQGTCIVNIVGKKGDDSQSTSSNANSRQQYKLKSSTASSCQYVSEPDEAVQLDVTQKSNKLSFSCSVQAAVSTACNVTNSSASIFDNNGTFTCPAYVYATKTLENSSNLSRYKLTIEDSGTEADQDRTEEKDKADGTVNIDDMNGTIGCTGVFGTVDANGNFTEESFGWLIQTALNYIKIAGPILVILLSMIEFIKAILSSDEEAMKKAQSRLVIRIIAVVVLFLLPFLVGEVLKLINGISNPTCGFK